MSFLKVLYLLFFIALPLLANAQSPATLESVIAIALSNNLSLKGYQKQIETSQTQVPMALDFGKTHVYTSFDQNNKADNGLPLWVWGVNQNFMFPSFYIKQSNYFEQKVNVSTYAYECQKWDLLNNVSKKYLDIVYANAKIKQLVYLDSLFTVFESLALRDDTLVLDKVWILNITDKRMKIDLELESAHYFKQICLAELNTLLSVDTNLIIEQDSLFFLQTDDFQLEVHPVKSYYQSQVNLLNLNSEVVRSSLMPELSVGFFQGLNNGPNSRPYNGFQAGVGVPLFWWAGKANAQASKLAVVSKQYELESYNNQLTNFLLINDSKIEMLSKKLDYFYKNGLALSDAIYDESVDAFTKGTITFLEFIVSLQSTVDIKLSFLDVQREYYKCLVDKRYPVISP